MPAPSKVMRTSIVAVGCEEFLGEAGFCKAGAKASERREDIFEGDHSVVMESGKSLDYRKHLLKSSGTRLGGYNVRTVNNKDIILFPQPQRQTTLDQFLLPRLSQSICIT